MCPRWMICPLLLLTLLSASAQQNQKSTNNAPRLYRAKIEPHWFADASGATNRFWYRLDLADGQTEFVLADAAKGTRQPAFDHARLAAALSRQSGKTVAPNKLVFATLTFSPDGKTLAFQGETANGSVNLTDYSLTLAADAAEAESLPNLKTPHPSSSNSEETSIKFVNRLPRTVNIFWVDDEGGRQPYGQLAAGESHEFQTYVGHVWLIAADNGDALAVFEAVAKAGLGVIGAPEPKRNFRPRAPRAENAEDNGTRSPDQQWEVLVRGHNLFLRSTTNGAITQLTYDATPGNSYARNAEADRGMGMNYDARDPERALPEIFWAPDSKHFVAMKHKSGTQRLVHIVQSSPEEQFQPKLVSFPYLKPGDDVPYSKPHLFDASAKTEIPVPDTLFPNPWTIDWVRWAPDSTRFTFLYNQRGHQALRILGVDAQSGAVRPIVDEQSKTFICYSGKFFSEYLDDTGEIIWMSERDGWNHLYLYDAKTGAVKTQITRGEWVVRSVDRVDREKRQIWFQASGLRPAEDPYFIHHCRVNFDGSGLTVLTEGDGTHTIQWSPDQRFLIDTWSRVDQPPINELRRADDGKLLCRLEEADAKELFASGWRTPERFTAKGRDGTTDICGIIVRPKHFDATKKYPVIENIYAGPQDSYVPKAFATANRMQALADRGFILVQMDGMGTANRSKKFHDVCWKNIVDAGFPDRILWIKAAAAKFPALDLARVGVYGTSAGGQNAMRAVLDHGDFYKAAVADSGCHDNRMDKIWWNEQWMGWPLDASYERSSNVADAHKLQGKLLLMTGEMDNNVDPASAMQVVNALVKADKDFEMLIVPNVGHGVVRSPYGAKRLQEFFVRTLNPDQN